MEREKERVGEVAPEENGEGLPYAPVDWPKRGDTWRWRVGKRVATTGHFLDRYLYLPKRLIDKEKASRKKHGFASRLAVERYLRSAFPGADIDAFFASFCWKIPSKHSSGEVADSEEEGEDGGGEGVCCKAGNTNCSSFIEADSRILPMPCDICCTELGFCRDCCCILCCKPVNADHGGCSYVRCEAVVSEGCMCGHVAHIKCALRSYIAGTVGGSIGLDSEYYCRRCDARSDLVPHVMKLPQICESLDSQDEIEKVLYSGICILRGTRRTDAQELLNRIQSAIIKLKCGTAPGDIWKDDGDSVMFNGVGVSESADAFNEDHFNNGISTPDKASLLYDCQAESLKLNDEIDQVLQELQMSQGLEYKIAEEKLNNQKNYLQYLYKQLAKKRAKLAGNSSITNSDVLVTSVSDRVEQIKQEVTKLKDMEKVANGFGRTSKQILKEHFNLDIEE